MIKVAVVGMGKMGLTHAAMLEVLSPGCIAGVVESVAGNHGTLRSLGLKAPIYTDLDSLLAAGPVDAAIVSTPTFTHFDIVKTLIERAIAVLIEKPLAENLERCLALAGLAAKHGAITAVGYSIDYDPLFNEARRLLPDLGPIRRYTAWVEHAEVFGPKSGWLFQKSKSGGGVIINPAPHMLFFLLEAFGAPSKIRAELRSPYSAVEDEAVVALDYTGGCAGLLKASWSVPNKPALELSLFIEGERGALALGDDEILLDGAAGPRRIHRSDLPLQAAFELSPAAHAANYYREDRDFLECVRLKRAPRNSIENTVKVDRLIDAIYRSGESREAVAWS